LREKSIPEKHLFSAGSKMAAATKPCKNKVTPHTYRYSQFYRCWCKQLSASQQLP